MKNDKADTIMQNDYLGCFGEFMGDNRICRKLCSLGLRCAIERNQIDQMELMEDLEATEFAFMRVQ